MDKNAVHFLSTGATGAESSVGRRNGRAVETVKAPKLVRGCHELMGVSIDTTSYVYNVTRCNSRTGAANITSPCSSG